MSDAPKPQQKAYTTHDIVGTQPDRLIDDEKSARFDIFTFSQAFSWLRVFLLLAF